MRCRSIPGGGLSDGRDGQSLDPDHRSIPIGNKADRAADTSEKEPRTRRLRREGGDTATASNKMIAHKIIVNELEAHYS